MGPKDQLSRLGALLATALLVLPGSAAAAPIRAVPPPGKLLAGTQRLLVIGDSTTRAGSCGDGDRYALGSWLNGPAGFPTQFVGGVTVGCHPPYNHCECWDGQTILFARSHIAAWLAAAQPTVVLVRFGINDLGQWNGNRAPAQALDDMAALVGDIRTLAPDARILVDQLFEPNGEVSPALADASWRAQVFNEGLADRLGPFGDWVHIGHLSLVSTRWLSGDGLHPSDTGLVGAAQLNYRALEGWYTWDKFPRTNSVFDFVPEP